MRFFPFMFPPSSANIVWWEALGMFSLSDTDSDGKGFVNPHRFVGKGSPGTGRGHSSVTLTKPLPATWVWVYLRFSGRVKQSNIHKQTSTKVFLLNQHQHPRTPNMQDERPPPSTNGHGGLTPRAPTHHLQVSMSAH